MVSTQMFYIFAPFRLKVASNHPAKDNKWGKKELGVNDNQRRAAQVHTWPIPNCVSGFPTLRVPDQKQYITMEWNNNNEIIQESTTKKVIVKFVKKQRCLHIPPRQIWQQELDVATVGCGRLTCHLPRRGRVVVVVGRHREPRPLQSINGRAG